MDRPLDGRVAIVTGASSGIGAAIATHLARAGAKVAMAARREEKLQEVVHSIEDEGGVAIAVRTDVTKRQDVRDYTGCFEPLSPGSLEPHAGAQRLGKMWQK